MGDPRLTGALIMHVRALLRTNPKPGLPPDPNLGTLEGRFTVKQPDQVVAEGRLYGTIEGTEARLAGFAVGRTTTVDRGGDVYEGGNLLGHFRAVGRVDRNRTIGEFGGVDPEPTDPMVVQSGSCRGPVGGRGSAGCNRTLAEPAEKPACLP